MILSNLNKILFQPFEPPLASSTPKRKAVQELEKEQQQEEKEKQEVQGETMEGTITLEEGLDGEVKESTQEATLSVDEEGDSFFRRFLCNQLFWDMTVVCQVQEKSWYKVLVQDTGTRYWY